MQEKEIIALLRERNERGAEELLTHYGAFLRYIIAPILISPQDREDCLSETVMRIWDKIEQYHEERGSWRAWLTALCRNTALNFARKGRNGETEALTAEYPSPEMTPEEAVVKRERSEALKRALDCLPNNDRLLFYRKYYYLQTTSQIASELGMTVRAVEGRLYRLKRTLREKLGGEEIERAEMGWRE